MTTYQLSPLPVLIGVVLVLGLCFLIFKMGRDERIIHRTPQFPLFSNVLIGVIILMTLVMAPSFVLDKITVSSEKVSGKYGLWFSQREVDMPFAEVAKIEVYNRGRETLKDRNSAPLVIAFEKKDSSETVYSLSTVMMFALDSILDVAKSHNIVIDDMR